MPVTHIPYLSIHAGQIVHYSKTEGLNSKKKTKNPYKTTKEEKEAKAHEAAWKVKKRIYKAVTILYDSSKSKTVYQKKTNSYFKFKVNFVTLTLPGAQKHSDKEIHEKVFKSFIRAWKQKEPNLLYVYRAETQENGNLHYHLVTNSFIHHRDLRNMWNYYCYKAGYQDHDNANSTDVHSLKKVSNPAAYIAKYITKPEGGRRKVEIKKWGCSKAISDVKNIQIECPDKAVLKECVILHKVRKTTVKYEYCSIQKFKKEYLSNLPILNNLYGNMLKEVIEINEKTNAEDLVIW